MSVVGMPKTDPVDVPSKFGATARDAELLLRKAKVCAIFIRTGENSTTLFELPRNAIHRELKHHPATEPMPCELDLGSPRPETDLRRHWRAGAYSKGRPMKRLRSLLNFWRQVAAMVDAANRRMAGDRT